MRLGARGPRNSSFERLACGGKDFSDPHNAMQMLPVT